MEVQLKDFDFKKSKVKDGVVYVDYSINFKANGGVRHPKISDEITDPHPDLIKSVKAFLDILLDIWEFEVKDENEVQVTGVSFSGKEENEGLIITGKKSVEGGVVAMNSHRIRLAGETLGIEGKLAKLYEDHKKEVFAALYEGKTAQMKIPFKDDKKK
jgi:hypothetical protein